MFLDDLLSVLATAGVGTINQDLFQTSRHAVPDGDGPYLMLKELGGSSPLNTHNRLDLPAWVNQGCAVIVRGKVPSTTRAMLLDARAALYPIRNTTINSVVYQRVRLLNEPHDIGLDDKQRIMFGFDILVTKWPDET